MLRLALFAGLFAGLSITVSGFEKLASAAVPQIANREAIIAKRLAIFGSKDSKRIRAAMDEIPQKYDASGKPFTDSYTVFFDGSRLSGNEFVDVKDDLRRQFLGAFPEERSGVESGDEAYRLLGEMPKFTKLDEMQAAKLESAELITQPWSDDYWAIYSGLTAKRYSDPKSPRTGETNWKVYSDYILENLGGSHVNETGCSLDQLSPAEKYDMIVGDQNFTLTKAQLKAGEPYFLESGKVESWMGICHGWAPASYMLPRPSHAVASVQTPFGISIKLYPSDIKALATLLWANANVRQTRFMGGRCNTKKPEKDENGRIVEQRCFDNNPAAFHTVMVSSIGVINRSFVMDVTYDYEVWNQPVKSYRYTYFNPSTREQTTLEKARVSTEEFTNDIFKKYRDPKSKFFVGIAMDITYLVETVPSIRETDAPENDWTHTVQYMYDLELDEAGNIIGGEWYSNAHPDFLWTPDNNARAQSYGDMFLNELQSTWQWNAETEVMPEVWRKVAVETSTVSQPLARVVEALISASVLSK